MKINNTTAYPNTTPERSDHVPGTDVSDTGNSPDGETVTFTIASILDAEAFETRSDLVTWASSNTPAVGTVRTADGLFYEYDGSSTGISDLSGWKPHGDTWWIEQFGAVDTAANTLTTLQALADALTEGVTVKGQAQLYSCNWPADDSIEANRVVIATDHVTFDFAPGTVFRNVPIYVKGSYGAEMDVGAAGFGSGDNEINTASAHGLSAEDFVQCLSQRNAYTADAGAFQMGSQNPTNLGLPESRLSEIHQIAAVPTTTTARIYDQIIYDDYLDNVSGLSSPMTGITSATVRKLTMRQGIVFKGIDFEYTDDFYTGIVCNAAVDLRFENCGFWDTDTDTSGAVLVMTDCLRVRIVDCRLRNNLASQPSGSSWNTIKVFGGCQDIFIDGLQSEGGAQVIDFTPLIASGDVGYSDVGGGTDYRTVQIVGVINSTFRGAWSQAVTTHPSVYDFKFEGNSVLGSSNGVLVRSRKNIISGNNIETYNGGITCSSFYEDTVISGNTFTAIGAESDWQCLSVTPLSSETMNNNNIQRFVFSENTINGDRHTNAQLQFRHANNGAISSPLNPSFALFTDAVKTAMSGYVIRDNTFHDCWINIQRWINGVHIIGNRFYGSVAGTHYIDKADNGARLVAFENYFDGTDDVIYAGDADSGLSYGFSLTGNFIGINYGPNGNIFNAVTNQNSIDARADTSGLLINGLKSTNGTTFKTIRESGAATMYLEAEAQDGSSDETIAAFANSSTTGTKTFKIHGDVDSARAIGKAVFVDYYATNTTPGTTDMTNAIQSADDRAAAIGGYVVFTDEQYLIDPATAQLQPAARWIGKVNLTVAAKSATNDSPAILCDDSFVADEIDITFGGNNYRGIQFGSGSYVRKLTVSNSTYNSTDDTNDACVRITGDHTRIESFRGSGHAKLIKNIGDDTYIGEAVFDDYVCGINNEGSRLTCLVVRGLAANANATTSAGHNCVLDGSGDDSYYGYIYAKDAGEHAVRLSGTAARRGIRIGHIEAINPGGNAFKCSPDTGVGILIQFEIGSIYGEDAGSGTLTISRQDIGVLVERCTESHIGSIVLQPNASTDCAFCALEVNNISGLTVDSLRATGVTQSFVTVRAYTGDVDHLTIKHLEGEDSADVAVLLCYPGTGNELRNINISGTVRSVTNENIRIVDQIDGTYTAADYMPDGVDPGGAGDIAQTCRIDLITDTDNYVGGNKTNEINLLWKMRHHVSSGAPLWTIDMDSGRAIYYINNLADDASTTVELPPRNANAKIEIYENITAGGAYGLALAKVRTSGSTMIEVTTSNTQATTTDGTLAGTTGSDTTLNYRLEGTTIHIENRRGSTVDAIVEVTGMVQQ